MKEFRKGDRVKFLNDTGGGEVTGIIDRDMVSVLTDEGFEYPVLKKELIHTGSREEADNQIPAGESVDSAVSGDINIEELKPGESTISEGHIVPAPKNIVSGGARREKKREIKKNSIEEVDLHIGQIIDDWHELSPGEIVEIQLARFRTSLQGAIIARQQRIVFIHGKGAGKLKYELEKILRSEYPDCRYQDASFREYGYGATMVYTPGH